MPSNESIQKRLQRVRAPRVQMTYDLEIGDAIENKELPFVLGVLGDFGSSSQQRLKERSFIGVDTGNFDAVLASMAPAARFTVPNQIDGQGGQLGVVLEFKAMSDFRPEAVVQQVEPLRDLLAARHRLADLRNKLAGNDKLEDLLSEVLSNTEQLREIHAATRPNEEE